MALNANSYGSVAGVEAYVAHLTAAGVFTVNTRPTLAQVEGFIDQMSARLNAWIAQAGYTIPVSVEQAVLVLSNFANLGAAGLAELTQRVGGYDADDVNRRENKFLAEFEKAEAYIKSGALTGLGVPQTNASLAAAISFVPATYGGANTIDEYSRPPRWYE